MLKDVTGPKCKGTNYQQRKPIKDFSAEQLNFWRRKSHNYKTLKTEREGKNVIERKQYAP